jgi:hypothetical protein
MHAEMNPRSGCTQDLIRTSMLFVLRIHGVLGSPVSDSLTCTQRESDPAQHDLDLPMPAVNFSFSEFQTPRPRLLER